MKAISLYQPWAQLLAAGVKRLETRSWMTTYQGPVAIHAGARMDDAFMALAAFDPHFHAAFREYGWTHWSQAYGDLPFGAIIGVATLRLCVGVESPALAPWLTPPERAFGNFSPGRYAWIFDDARLITPIPYRGRQRLFNIPDSLPNLNPVSNGKRS